MTDAEDDPDDLRSTETSSILLTRGDSLLFVLGDFSGESFDASLLGDNGLLPKTETVATGGDGLSFSSSEVFKFESVGVASLVAASPFFCDS